MAELVLEDGDYVDDGSGGLKADDAKGREYLVLDRDKAAGTIMLWL